MSDEPLHQDLEFHPLTAERWSDLEALFGKRGACGGCWCMWWRLSNAEFEMQKGEGTRLALQALVGTGDMPGILAYKQDKPIGWCSLAPRERFSRLARSRVLKPVDDQPVWSVVCFFVARGYRGQGVSKGLLQAAVEYAVRHGARIVEGYPVQPKKDKMPDVFAYTGVPSAYLQAGFVEVARRSETRPIMRYFAART